MPGRKTRRTLDQQVHLRVPKAVLARIKKVAVAQDRSINATCLRALEAYSLSPDECEAVRRAALGEDGK